MTQNNELNDYIIESLKCSFINCDHKLIPSDKYFVYYYYKEEPPLYNQNGMVINQIHDVKPIEIKFICRKCIDKIRENGGQFFQSIVEGTQLNTEQFSIQFEKDEGETANPPKQGNFTLERQYCKKCLDNQKDIQEFDRRIQAQRNSQNSIEIAKYYAKEQYKNDQVIFQQLQQRLFAQNQVVGNMQRLMILNKMKMIMKKYQ